MNKYESAPNSSVPPWEMGTKQDHTKQNKSTAQQHLSPGIEVMCNIALTGTFKLYDALNLR